MNDQRPARLLMLSVIGCFLLLQPILSVYDVPLLKYTIPSLYLYLFGVWVLFILATRYLVNLSEVRKKKP